MKPVYNHQVEVQFSILIVYGGAVNVSFFAVYQLFEFKRCKNVSFSRIFCTTFKVQLMMFRRIKILQWRV
jgi:hypothetical protein